MSASIRMGFCGVGGNGRHHLKRLCGRSEVEMVAICDPSTNAHERALSEIGGEADPKPYKDLKHMLEHEELDALGISTPHTQHVEQTLAGLETGLHIFVEKPMVCTADEARQVIAAEKKADKEIFIAYQRHYQPAYVFAREQVAGGELGTPLYVAAYLSQGWRNGCAGTWRQDPEFSGGGFLADSGSHLVDIVHFICGAAPEQVTALTDDRGRSVNILTAASVRYRGGLLGTVAGVGHAVAFIEEIAVWCENGILRVNGGVWLKAKDGEMEQVEKLPEGTTPDDRFVDVLLGKATNDSPAEYGLWAAAFNDAVFLSAEKGCAVETAL